MTRGPRAQRPIREGRITVGNLDCPASFDQLVGRYGDEATLLRLAAQLEADAPWRERRPPVA
jgi:Asp-tRNA(Asn)/Glu-tRNA(Gln) amidotransferase A subunit family amidase